MSDVDIKWLGREFFELATKETVRATTKAAIVVQAEARRLTGGPGTGGRTYKRTKGKKGSSKYHRVSAPGQPPARDFGVLTNSIMHLVKRGIGLVSGWVGSDIDSIRNKLAARGDVGSDVNYPFFLEVGTSKMQPRPWLRPALKKSEKKILSIYQKAFSK